MGEGKGGSSSSEAKRQRSRNPRDEQHVLGNASLWHSSTWHTDATPVCQNLRSRQGVVGVSSLDKQ